MIKSDSDSKDISPPINEQKGSWDVFISHAFEDKNDVARPLAKILENNGLKVWFDETELRLGDSLRERIDHGLHQSHCGIVILSEAFFAKDWPKRELNGLFALEVTHKKKIIPVWHEIEFDAVRKYSPILSDRVAVKTTFGIESVAIEIIRAIRSGKKTSHQKQATQSSMLREMETRKKANYSPVRTNEEKTKLKFLFEKIIQLTLESTGWEIRNEILKSLPRYLPGDVIEVITEYLNRYLSKKTKLPQNVYYLKNFVTKDHIPALLSLLDEAGSHKSATHIGELIGAAVSDWGSNVGEEVIATSIAKLRDENCPHIGALEKIFQAVKPQEKMRDVLLEIYEILFADLEGNRILVSINPESWSILYSLANAYGKPFDLSDERANAVFKRIIKLSEVWLSLNIGLSLHREAIGKSFGNRKELVGSVAEYLVKNKSMIYFYWQRVNRLAEQLTGQEYNYGIFSDGSNKFLRWCKKNGIQVENSKKRTVDEKRKPKKNGNQEEPGSKRHLDDKLLHSIKSLFISVGDWDTVWEKRKQIHSKLSQFPISEIRKTISQYLQSQLYSKSGLPSNIDQLENYVGVEHSSILLEFWKSTIDNGKSHPKRASEREIAHLMGCAVADWKSALGQDVIQLALKKLRDEQNESSFEIIQRISNNEVKRAVIIRVFKILIDGIKSESFKSFFLVNAWGSRFPKKNMQVVVESCSWMPFAENDKDANNILRELENMMPVWENMPYGFFVVIRVCFGNNKHLMPIIAQLIYEIKRYYPFPLDDYLNPYEALMDLAETLTDREFKQGVLSSRHKSFIKWWDKEGKHMGWT